jgi:ribosomal protein L17
MEVHHHPHIEKKSFKEYILEGIMIFVAVTMGFFAENIREYLVEQKQEKEYMKSMSEDIVKDTAMLTVTHQRALKVYSYIDTILTILKNDQLNEKDILTLYRVNLNCLNNFAPSFTDRTTAELKNSGGIRVIRKKIMTDGIVDYWNQLETIKSINETIEEYKFKTRELSYSIFNARYYAANSNGGYVTDLHPKLMTTDFHLLTEYANRLSHIQALIKVVYTPRIQTMQKNAKKMIDLIEREYHLEKE